MAFLYLVSSQCNYSEGHSRIKTVVGFSPQYYFFPSPDKSFPRILDMTMMITDSFTLVIPNPHDTGGKCAVEFLNDLVVF